MTREVLSFLPLAATLALTLGAFLAKGRQTVRAVETDDQYHELERRSPS